MLEAIRRFGVERRWVFGLVLGLVTVTFVGTMGWMGLSGPAGSYAAKVNGEVVLLGDFQKAYRDTYQKYQRMMGDQFSPELMQSLNLPMHVVMGLVDRKLWISLSREMDIRVTDDEVRAALSSVPAFQVGGRFSAPRYMDLLARMHTSPEDFERGVREDLLMEKARGIVAAAARVTAADLALSPVPPVQPGGEGDAPEDPAARLAAHRNHLLDQKRAQVIAAYTDHLRKEATIHVYRENLGV